MESELSKSRKNQVGSVLVIGGGIGGIQAALDSAESGYYVYLLEKSPSIGGIMAQLDKTFPTNDCSMCILSPKLVECGRHLNIELTTNAELKEITGEPGRFKVRILKKPRFIDVDKCTGCGLCAQSDFTELKEREESVWVDRIKIDESKCIQCGDCVQACLEENPERQGLTNVAWERRRFIELSPEDREGRVEETLWQQVALIDDTSRFEFWSKELSKCIKCYGCRDVCPLCTCEECELEDPEWITPGKIPPDFPLFHIIRAYHIADSCVNCGACEETCPMNIPLRTIQQLIWHQPAERIFEYVPGLDPEKKERLIQRTKEHPIAERSVRK